MDISTLLTVAGSVAGIVIGSVASVFIARTRAKVDVGTALTDAFAKLTDLLQEERDHFADAVKQQTATIETLEQTIRRMRRHIDLIETIMEKSGTAVPPHVGWE